MNLSPRIIALLGAECTGKSTLCAQLRAALPAIAVPEYLRQWCAERKRTPTQAEQRQIIAGQLAAEQDAVSQARTNGMRWVVLDSSPLLTAIYSLEYFNDNTLLPEALAEQRRYALSLVLADDIVWVADGIQRDGPQRRNAVQRRLLELLTHEQLNFQRITGSSTQRLEQVLRLTAQFG